MTAAEVLSMIEGCGASVSVNEGKIKLKAPSGVITPEIRKAVADSKTEIIAFLLKGRPREPAGPSPETPEGVLPWQTEQTAPYPADLWDTFCGFVALLTRSPALWPNIRRYCQQELPGKLFKELAEEYAGACATGVPINEQLQSSLMVKCVQCSMLAGTTCKKVKKEVDGIVYPIVKTKNRAF